MMVKKLIIVLGLFCITSGCDIEGEVRQGSINSSISTNSGAAGGNTPVLGGVYYDSLEGLTISNSGTAGQTLFLNEDLEPQWAAPVINVTENISMNGFYLSNDGDSEGIFVDSLGNVGIGTTTPTHEFHVEGNAFKSEGGANWITVSDKRLKQNIKPISKGLEDINKLNIVEFEYIANERLGLKQRKDSGLVAQEVINAFPEAVLYSGAYMMLDYHPIYIAQLRAVQQLSQENAKLEKRIAELESKISKLLK